MTNRLLPVADNFHGTHLAGIVGAVCNNHIGVCGVTPSVKAMACKFLDSNGNGYTSDAIRCMSYALQVRSPDYHVLLCHILPCLLLCSG